MASFAVFNQVQSAPITHTQSPTVTGSSVVAIKYNGGVLLAADTLASYGSMARFKDVERLSQVTKDCVIGVSGEYSDYQALQETIGNLTLSDQMDDDGTSIKPRELYCYLSRTMYGRRSKFDPLWNSVVVAGFRDNQSFLGLVDLVGTSFEDNLIATGFGNYLAIPLMRNAYEKAKNGLTRDEAHTLLKDCLRVLFYRDCRALNRIQFAEVTADGAKVHEPEHLDTYWEFEAFKRGAKPNSGSW